MDISSGIHYLAWGWVYQEMNRCHWCLGLLLFCTLRSHMVFLLQFECVTRVSASGKHRLDTAASEKPKHNSGWLPQQEHLTVSILSAIVYPWGIWQLALSNLCPPCPHRKWRTAWPLYVSKTSSFRLAVSVFTLFWNIYVTCTPCFYTDTAYGCHDGFVY